MIFQITDGASCQPGITRRVSVQQKAHHTFCCTMHPIDGFRQTQIRMFLIQTQADLNYEMLKKISVISYVPIAYSKRKTTYLFLHFQAILYSYQLV